MHIHGHHKAIKNTLRPEIEPLDGVNNTLHVRMLDKISSKEQKLFKKYDRTEQLKLPWPGSDIKRPEEEFIVHRTSEAFLRLSKEYEEVYFESKHQKFFRLNEIFIDPSNKKAQKSQILKSQEQKLKAWHQKRQDHFIKNRREMLSKSSLRHQKLEEQGQGYGGRMTKSVAKAQTVAFYTKNNLTMRGQIFHMSHRIFGKNLNEMLPRYGHRKGAHVAVRVSQFTINGILSALGYAFIPVTFGLSKVVSDHLGTVITLSGETIAHKLDGAKGKKITVHAGLRGAQLSIPKSVPIVGSIIDYAENAVMGTAACGIVSTTIIDAILSNFSVRYQSTINTDDLGDSSVLQEINTRIDYLSRFLLPYGQYLLLQETDLEKGQEIRKALKHQFKIMRDLEHKLMRTLNYYRLALAAEAIPISHLEKIKKDCEDAELNHRINSYRMVRRCLTTLIAENATPPIDQEKNSPHQTAKI